MFAIHCKLMICLFNKINYYELLAYQNKEGVQYNYNNKKMQIKIFIAYQSNLHECLCHLS